MSYVDLPQDILVYRALRNKSWLREPTKAFIRRFDEPEGFSVLRSDRCPREEVHTKSGLKTTHGSYPLLVAEVNATYLPESAVCLRCQQDPTEEAAGDSHSYIVNMPSADEDGHPGPEAVHCAELLWEQARKLNAPSGVDAEAA